MHPKSKFGMILGRFQPFHLEHLRYFRLAWEQSDHIVIGITNPDPSAVVEDESNHHRHLPEENPFNFFERLIMIQDTLRTEGYPLERIHIIPMPVHHPDRWRYYIPADAVIFIVAYSAWEKKKSERFRAAGYKVVEVDTLKKTISGSQVRSIIRSGGDWGKLVPPAVALYLRNRPERTA